MGSRNTQSAQIPTNQDEHIIVQYNKRCPLGHQHNDFMRARALVHTHVWLNVAAFENPECSNYNYITTTAMSIINTRNKCELTTC